MAGWLPVVSKPCNIFHHPVRIKKHPSLAFRAHFYHHFFTFYFAFKNQLYYIAKTQFDITYCF